MTGLAALPAQAQSDQSEPPSTSSSATPNCRVEAVPADELGSTKQTPRCYASYADVLRSFGYDDVPDDATPESYDTSGDAEALLSPLATFIDINPSPDESITIGGTDCAGGGVTFDTTWDNRFDRVTHQACFHVKHHYYFCDASPDFHTYGSSGQTVSYAAGDRDKEDCVTFHAS